MLSVSLLKARTPSIRGLADYLPSPHSKQAKTFKPFIVMKALFFIASKLSNSPYVIIDFTSLDGFKVKLFIASLAVRGRSLPFYCKPLYLRDIHNLRFKSENEFIMFSIKELLSIIPEHLRERIILLGDRQFGTKRFLIFFKEEGIRFIVRVKKNLLVKVRKEVIRCEQLKKGKYMVDIEGEGYFLYVREDGREKLILVSNFENIDSLKASRKYLKRSYCEQMHRDLKSRLRLLFLNSKYYKKLDEEKVKKYLVLFMLAEIVGIWIGKLTKRSKYYSMFCSKEDERSLFHLGQIIISQIYVFQDIGLRFRISAMKLFLIGRRCNL
ncbi:MAG: hypothetical protein D6828_04735 [Nitrospirae bacterium]|nr:MAG: hypothetical protein D6828_04735 [Nitrospirota bacterium]